MNEELKRFISHYRLSEVAQKFGVSEATVKKWRQGQKLPYYVSKIWHLEKELKDVYQENETLERKIRNMEYEKESFCNQFKSYMS